MWLYKTCKNTITFFLILFYTIFCISCCFLSQNIYCFVIIQCCLPPAIYYYLDIHPILRVHEKYVFHLRCVTQIVPYTKSLLKSLELLNTNLTLDWIINNQNVMYWSMRLYLPSEIFYVAASWRFCCISELHDSSNPSLALLLIF